MSFEIIPRCRAEWDLATRGRRLRACSVWKAHAWTPASAQSPGERLHELVHKTLRGSVMASIPFYVQAKVVALLDRLPTLADDARTAFDPIPMFLLSACSLHERYKL